MSTIYLVFTQDGFEQAKPLLLDEKAILWINQDVLTPEQQTELLKASISVNTLPQNADPSNEKSVLLALEYVEKQAPDAEILVEYL
jgi:hypothetical protein